MKNTLLLFSFLCCMATFSQSYQLENNIWYLSSLTVDGEDITNQMADNDSYETGLTLISSEGNLETFFGEGSLEITPCISMTAQLDFDNNESFSIINHNVTGENCESEGYSNYGNYYFNNFFLLNEDPTVQYNFQYSIGGDEGTNLTIINPNGDVAFFWNEVLSSSSFDSEKLAIYPNPSENHFSIESAENLTIKNLQVFNLQGKLIKTFNHESENRYDISVLNSGVYILKIKGKNRDFSKKLVVE